MCDEIKYLKDIMETILFESSKVFIVGHNDPDFDSIGSAIGLQSLCTHLGKEAYIIVDDCDINLEPGVKKIIDENRKIYKIISLADAQKLKDDNVCLIMTDVNNYTKISIGEELDDFENLIIIDHHNEGLCTVYDATYSHMDTKASSASEIVGQLLNYYKIKCSKDVYTFLLAGIALDTDRYTKNNTTGKTHDVVKKLIARGADNDYVNELFLEEFDNDRRISELIFNGSLFQSYEYSLVDVRNVSFTLNREKPTTIYKKEDIAKAADRMLKYKGNDASFVMGHTADDVISVSARSRGNIDVSEIMKVLGGGGSLQNAGARITDKSIVMVEEVIKECMRNYGLHTEDLPAEIPDEKVIIAPRQKTKVL